MNYEGREPTPGAKVARYWEDLNSRNKPRRLNSKLKLNGTVWRVIARAGDIVRLRNHYILEAK